MSPLPPGPHSAIVQTYRFVRDPRAYFEACVARYGDPFTFPLIDGPKVVMGDAKLVGELFAADPDAFAAPTPELAEPLFGARSLPLAEGAPHRRKRKLLMPAFHGARMKVYGGLMAEITEARVASLTPGQRVDASSLAQDISLDVIIRAILGARRRARVDELRAAILESFQSFTSSLFYFPFLRRRFGGVGPWARYLTIRAKVDRMLQQEIDERRAEGDRDDIISLLLGCRDDQGQGLSDREIIEELRTMLIAGHETTATSIAWALYEVHRHPSAARRLDDDLAPLRASIEADALTKLPYLGAICDETLRLHPLTAVTLRRLKRPYAIGSTQYPAGTTLAPALVLAHFNRDVFPDPDAFRPERFVDRSYAPGEFFPFGGGSRRCLGAAFAGYEMKIVLGTLLARRRFALASSAPIPAAFRNITMGPKEPIVLEYKGRA